MATTMLIQEAAAEELRTLANSLDQSPDALAQEALAYGIHMLRRYARLKHDDSANTATALEVLARVGKENPPDPGDELS